METNETDKTLTIRLDSKEIQAADEIAQYLRGSRNSAIAWAIFRARELLDAMRANAGK